MIIWPHITELLLETYGLQGTLLVYSGIGLHGLICASLFRPQPKLHTSSQHTETNDEIINGVTVLKNPSVFRRISQWMYSHLPFTLFVLGFTLAMSGHSYVHNYTPLRAKELGIPVDKTAIIMSVIGITGM